MRLRIPNFIYFFFAAPVAFLISYLYFFEALKTIRSWQFQFWPEISGNMNGENFRNQKYFFVLFLISFMLYQYFQNRMFWKLKRDILKKFDSLRILRFMWFWLGLFIVFFLIRTFIFSSPVQSSSFWSTISNGHMSVKISGAPTPFADLLGPANCSLEKGVIKAGEIVTGCDPLGRDGPSIYPRFAFDYLGLLIPLTGIKAFALISTSALLFFGLFLLRRKFLHVIFYFFLFLSPAIALGVERANLSLPIVAFSWIGVYMLFRAKTSNKLFERYTLLISGTFLLQSHSYLKLFPVVGIVALAIFEQVTRSNRKYFGYQLIFAIIVFGIYRDEFFNTLRLNSGQIDSSYSFGNSLMADSINLTLFNDYSQFITKDTLWIVFLFLGIFLALRKLISLKLDVNKNTKGLSGFLYVKNQEVHFGILIFFISPLLFSSFRSVQYDYQLSMLLPVIVSLLCLDLTKYRHERVFIQGILYSSIFLFFSRGFLIHNLVLLFLLFSVINLLAKLLAESIHTFPKNSLIGFWEK